tara:strand:+ start:1690 stop:2940 length:1251 start_codon:yes stop_codon:yes gene_type:complete
MLRFYISILLFFNLFFNAHAEFEKSDTFTLSVLDEYELCERNFKRKNKLANEYYIYGYLPSSGNIRKKEILKCNKIFEKLIDKNINFKKLVNEAILNNESIKKNLYIKIYLEYHKNIYWNSDDIQIVKKSLDEIENNYLDRSDLINNFEAQRTMGSLGWFYNTKKNHADFDKALDYLTKAVKFTKNEHYLGYFFNNLGVVYDQDRSTKIKNNSIKKNNKIAFELYYKSAKLGVRHAHANLGKFYLLGLGGIKKNYNKALKHFKMARIAPAGDFEFSLLKILYNKKRVPKNLKEYLIWLEEYAIQNQSAYVFQIIAWVINEDEKIDKLKINFKDQYKWQYLCSKYCKDWGDKNRAIQEMDILEKYSLSKKQIKIAELDAKKWEDKNWNKPIQINSDKNSKEIDKTLTDIIKDAFIKR